MSHSFKQEGRRRQRAHRMPGQEPVGQGTVPINHLAQNGSESKPFEVNETE